MPTLQEQLAALKTQYRMGVKGLKSGTPNANLGALGSMGSTPLTGLASLYNPDGKLNIQGALGYVSDAYQKTEARNQARLDEVRGLYAGSEAAIEGQGATAKADILRREEQDLGSINADAVNRGIYGTTILDANRTMRKGETERGLGALAERIGLQKAGVKERLAGAIQSVTDDTGDVGALFGLIQQQSSQDAEKTARDEDTKRRDKELADIKTELQAQKRTGYWAYGSWLPGGRQWIDTTAPESGAA